MKRALALVLLLAAAPAPAAKRPYLVRSFLGVRSSSGTGDREIGSDGAFWIPYGELDPDSGGLRPHAVRLLADGTMSDWSLDKEPLAAAPTALKVDAQGTIWVLVPLAGQSQSILYALGPADVYIRRFPIPILATDLAIDPVQLTPWLSGPGWLGSLDNKNFTAFQISHATGSASRIDASARRIWLTADDGSLIAFDIDRGFTFVYPGFGETLSALDLDAGGVVWGLASSGTRLVSFDAASSRKTSWPLTPSSTGWSRPGVGKGGLVALCSASGPNVALLDPVAVPGAVSATLDHPEGSSGYSWKGPNILLKPAADEQKAAATPVDRVEYRETLSGRTLFSTEGVDYGTILWSDGGEVVTGPDPVQWWQPLDPAGTFQTQTVLPVVAEVRPGDPTNNFLTEVTLANVDADRDVALVLTTASASYTVTVAVPPGGTVFWPDAMSALRRLGAAIPVGAYGSLAATFTNGRGTMAARVYTLFGDDTKLPRGSTTGLGFSSVDPAARLLVGTSTLNGLKSTLEYRTNVALANVCGAKDGCAGLTMGVEFFDDATGTSVGKRTVELPPHGLVQLDGPLAALGATGETFSIQVKPASGGPSAYDAYATVISNIVQDASFVRAAPSVASRALTIPVVTDSAGIGTRFTSEASVTNSGEGTAVADVTFTSVPTGKTVTDVLTLAPRLGIRWTNAVDHFRKLAPGQVAADDYGPVRFAFRGAASVFASSRTLATNGTGLALTALDPYRERASALKRVAGLRQGDAVRTNLAVVHLGATTGDPAPITLAVTVRDPAGNAVGAPLTRTLAPGELYQFTKVLEQLGATGDGFTATIERTSGVDAFDAYATIIDNVSSDPSFLRAE